VHCARLYLGLLPPLPIFIVFFFSLSLLFFCCLILFFVCQPHARAPSSCPSPYPVPSHPTALSVGPCVCARARDCIGGGSLFVPHRTGNDKKVDCDKAARGPLINPRGQRIISRPADRSCPGFYLERCLTPPRNRPGSGAAPSTYRPDSGPRVFALIVRDKKCPTPLRDFFYSPGLIRLCRRSRSLEAPLRYYRSFLFLLIPRYSQTQSDIREFARFNGLSCRLRSRLAN
jgi:hypothetical protein